MGKSLLDWVGGLAPLVGGAIGAITGADQNRKSREAASEMAKYQYGKDLEMWNRNNLYNSPEQQMERLRKAGLNPNLVYGQGAVANTAQAQAPKYQAPNLQFGIPNPGEGIAPSIMMFQDMQIKQQELKNLKAQNDAIQQSTIMNRFKTTAVTQGIQKFQQSWEPELETKWEKAWAMRQAREQKGELFPTQLSFAQGRNRQQEQQIGKLVADTRNKDLQNEWFTTNMIAKYGFQALGALTKLIPGASMGKGLAGAINQNRRPSGGAYNDAISWRLRNRRR